MTISTNYIPVRDDAGVRSLSRVERDFITTSCIRTTSSATKDSNKEDATPPSSTTSYRNRILRTDGRAWNQVRSHRLELVRWEQGASAMVQWGSATKVTCYCTAQITPPPNPDRPSEGAIKISVDLSPAASTSFRHGQPVTTGGGAYGKGTGVSPDPSQRLLTNRILRSLERIIIIGGALDTEALCITPGHWVWTLTLAVTVLDAAGGNVLDACTLACMAALRHYRKPQIESQQQLEGTEPTAGSTASGRNMTTSSMPLPPKLVSADIKEPTPLPIHHTPLSVSFAFIPHDESLPSMDSSDDSASMTNVLMDPNAREELALASGTTNTLIIAMNVHGEVCLLDFGGCEILPQALKRCASLANQCVAGTLCPALEKALSEADDKALQERLERLQKQMHEKIPPPTADNEVSPPSGIPFWMQEADIEVTMDQDADKAAAALLQTQAEEALRRQALDYNVAHVPSKVRDNSEDHGMGARPGQQRQDQESSALLAALIRSVQTNPNAIDSGSTADESKQGMDVDTEQQPSESQGKNSEDRTARVSAAAIGNATDDSLLKAEPTTITDARLDSDEEDITMELTSEFVEPQRLTKETKEICAETKPPVGPIDDDVDDLAAAIKKKKKKNKK